MDHDVQPVTPSFTSVPSIRDASNVTPDSQRAQLRPSPRDSDSDETRTRLASNDAFSRASSLQQRRRPLPTPSPTDRADLSDSDRADRPDPAAPIAPIAPEERGHSPGAASNASGAVGRSALHHGNSPMSDANNSSSSSSPSPLGANIGSSKASQNERRMEKEIEKASKKKRPNRFNPDSLAERPTHAPTQPGKRGKPKSSHTLQKEKLAREKQLSARKQRKATNKPTLGDICSDTEQDDSISAAELFGSDHDDDDDDDDNGDNPSKKKSKSGADENEENGDDDEDDGGDGSSAAERAQVKEIKRRSAAAKLAARQRKQQIIPKYTGPDDSVESDEALVARNLELEEQMTLEMRALEAEGMMIAPPPPPPAPSATTAATTAATGVSAGAGAGAGADNRDNKHSSGAMVDGPNEARGQHLVGGSGPAAPNEEVQKKKRGSRPLVVLSAQQERAKAAWKFLYRQQSTQKEMKAFGVMQSQIDWNTITADQVAAILLRPISDDALPAYLRQRLHAWMKIVRMVDTNVEEGFQKANYLFYRLESVPEMEERHMALLTAAERIRELMSRNGMLEIRDPAGRELVKELDAVQNNIDTIMICKLAAMDLMRGTKTHVSTKIARLASLRSSQQQLQQELAAAKDTWSTFAQVLDKILDRAQEWNLVRIEGQVSKPVLNEQHQWTRCYEQWQNGEILEFVHRAASLKQKDPEIYGMLYDRGTYWKQIVEILKYTYDDRFPEVQPSRYWYAFSNGVYNIKDDRFYEYGSLGFKHLPEEIVCCQFFNQKFDNAEYEWHMLHGLDKKDPWYNIPTPHLDKICDVQEWSTGERKWWYAGGGRMLFPLGELDNWGKMWIHLGRAGCGKTTFLKYIAGYFPRYKVGLINNNCEKVFTIQHLEKTWSWFGFDIKENWNLDQTLWNTMIDGGMLTLARKYLSSKLTDFNQHGAIASNRLMNWPDLNGQLLRRLFPHIYRKAPENMGVPTLARDMEVERGAALKKFSCGYRFKAEKHKSDQLVEGVLPKSIVNSLALIRREANPLMAFLESDRIVLDPDYYMERSKFIKEFSAYAVEIGIRGAKSLPSVNDAFFADVLEAKALKMANDIRKVPTGCAYQPDSPTHDHTDGRQEKRKMWIVGCALREFEDQQPLYRPGKGDPNYVPPPPKPKSTNAPKPNTNPNPNSNSNPSAMAVDQGDSAVGGGSRGAALRGRLATGNAAAPIVAGGGPRQSLRLGT